MVILMFKNYKKKIFQLRQGKYWFKREKINALQSIYYPGYQGNI